jgi:hypothetical protein
MLEWRVCGAFYRGNSLFLEEPDHTMVGLIKRHLKCLLPFMDANLKRQDMA